MFGAGLSEVRRHRPRECFGLPAAGQGHRCWGCGSCSLGFLPEVFECECVWMRGSGVGRRTQRGRWGAVARGGVLVSEKLEVEWDLAWPSRMSPKAGFKGGQHGRHWFWSHAKAMKEGFFFFS